MFILNINFFIVHPVIKCLPYLSIEPYGYFSEPLDFRGIGFSPIFALLKPTFWFPLRSLPLARVLPILSHGAIIQNIERNKCFHDSTNISNLLYWLFLSYIERKKKKRKKKWTTLNSIKKILSTTSFYFTYKYIFFLLCFNFSKFV